MKSKNKSSGQAVIEYVLLVAMMTLIFGAMFAAIRQSVYRLWICELAPRVQSAGGCPDGASQCRTQLRRTAPGYDPPLNCPVP
jgi:hypothetical protein